VIVVSVVVHVKAPEKKVIALKTLVGLEPGPYPRRYIKELFMKQGLSPSYADTLIWELVVAGCLRKEGSSYYVVKERVSEVLEKLGA